MENGVINHSSRAEKTFGLQVATKIILGIPSLKKKE
jgi:hypothetical protein